MAKGHNSGESKSSVPRFNMILIRSCDNNWKASLKSIKIAKGDAQTRITVEKLAKDHISGKNQSSMTSV